MEDKSVEFSQRFRPYISENLMIIWLDESNKHYPQFESLVTSTKIFNDVDQCVDFLTQLNNEEQTFLVISNDFGYSIISLIHEIPQIDSIYIFCPHECFNEKWRKVKAISDDIEHICNFLERDIHLNDVNFIPFTVFSETDSTKCPSLDELDRSFMYSLLLKEIFLNIEDDDQTKKELVQFWRLQYSTNNVILKIIDKFSNEYNPHVSIWWYTKENFIYSTVNRALREFDIDIIMKMKFFIRDLHRQIEQLFIESLNEQSALIVYRGQSISNDDFEKIKNNKGGLLSFNNFLSTSTDREISLLFAESAQHNSHLTSVLFRLEINNMISTCPYASINNFSHFESENEILFSMHSVFRIGDVKHMENRLYEVDLILTNDNDLQLKNLTDHIREEIGGGTGWHSLGNMMIRLGEFEKAKEIYEMLLHSTQDNDQTEIAHLYHQLGFIEKEKGNLIIALTYFQKTIDIQEQCLSPNDASLPLTYNRIGSIHYAMGDHKTALVYHQKAFDIQKKSHSDTTLTCSSMGDIYHSMGDYSTALSFYQMTLETQQKCLLPNDPSLATTYNCIATVHTDTGNYEDARCFYQKALDIEEKYLPVNHPSLSSTYNSIGDVHRAMKDYSTALEFYEKALQIQQKSYSSDHISFSTTIGRIGAVYHSMGDYSSALTFYQKSFKIREKWLPSDHLDFAISYTNIGTVHHSMGDYPNALLFYQKALQIEEKQSSTNSSQLAKISNNLGSVYQSMEDYSMSLLYYQKTLELWYKSSLPNYPDLAVIYNNLGVVHDYMKDYPKALDFYKKTVEIKQKFLPVDHISFATTYNNMGDAYRSLGDYPTALSYLQMTLAIEENYLPGDHPDLAITYNNIAKILTGLHEYHSAAEYAKQAINIAHHALGPMHPDVQLFQDNLNKILDKL